MKRNSRNTGTEVFARYITRNGRRIYPKKAKFFHFYVRTTNKK